jgi:hypothetical protein
MVETATKTVRMEMATRERRSRISMLRVAKSRVTTVEERKKVGAEKCEYVFDLHMSKVSKELKNVTTPPFARKRQDDWGFY